MTYFDYFYELSIELEKAKQTASNMCEFFKAGTGYLNAKHRNIYLQLADDYYTVLDKYEELLELFKYRKIEPDDKVNDEVLVNVQSPVVVPVRLTSL